MKAHAPPRPRGRVITSQRRVSSRNVYHGGGNATATPYTAPVPIPAVAAHETIQLQPQTFTEREVYCVEALIGGNSVVSSVNDFAYNLADDFFIMGQVTLSGARNMGNPSMAMGELIFHLDGLPASNGEIVGAGVTTLLTVGGGAIGRVGGTLLSRLFSPVVSRFASSSWGMMFSRWAGRALEAVGAVESNPAVATGAQLLDDGLKLLPEATPPNLGQGTIFTHFTNAEGVSGITGIQGHSLSVGQTVKVAELRFGLGNNSFLATRPSDMFVTDLGIDATAGQLNSIGVFTSTGKQNFAILFSQETALLNSIRPTLMREGIFTIPGNTTLNGEFLLIRIR